MEEYIKEAPQTGSMNKRLVRKYVHLVMGFLTYVYACMGVYAFGYVGMYLSIYVYVHESILVYYPTTKWQNMKPA